MSITISNCNEIHDSILNTSQSKAIWTFNKSERFPKQQQKTNCSQAFYDLPSVQDKRMAGIGRGSKYDFTKFMQQTPAPSKYDIQGEIEKNNEKKKGYIFGVSRERMSSTGIIGNNNQQNPGPGKYELGTTLSNIKFSIRPRLENELIQKSEIPGPGTYPTLPALNEKGKYVISKYRGSGCGVINPRSKRFEQSTKNSKDPGPGAYQVDKTYIQKDGKYFISTFQSSKCRSFPHEVRKTIKINTTTPGPGNYRLPSDFGHYQAKSVIE